MTNILRTLNDIAQNTVCVAVELKTYSAAEVGEENAAKGCWSIRLNFEHDPKKTDRDDMIVLFIELATDRIREYDFEMWDGRTFAEHLDDLGVA